MNRYCLPTSTYDRKNDKEVTDEDIKRNFKGQSDILINTTATEIKEIEEALTIIEAGTESECNDE